MKQKIRILILEDNLADIELLVRELKKGGFDPVPEVTQTREKYLFALNNFQPDLVLSDYSLPSFDGLSAFELKQGLLPDVPFIMVSGTIGEEKAVELIKMGVTDYVLKEKLFTLNQKITRALKEMKDMIEKRQAAERLKIQNHKLFEIAAMQSHQVRGPLAHILGLYNLFRFDDPSHPINIEVIHKLKLSAELLNDAIHEITKKTAEIEHLEERRSP